MNSANPPPVTTSESDEDAEPIDGTATRKQVIEQHETKNLLVLAANQILLRLGWIFKTESVIMPVFVDTIAGAGWVRGFLPVLNRFGQSLPPMFLADRLRRTRRKKGALFVTQMSMSVPFFIVAGLWWMLNDKRQPWFPPVFLLLYTLFFVIGGLNAMTFGTMQGKLIKAIRRGRLLGISGIVGSVGSVLCAWFLMQRWLALPDGGFEYIFSAAGVGFIAAAFVSLMLVEPADERVPKPRKKLNHLHSAWKVFRDDRNFRRMAIVAMLAITVQFLFPHYQALGRSKLNAGSFDLMIWVIAQNISVGIFSSLSGMLADRKGNRLTLRIIIFAASLAPLWAIFLTKTDVEFARKWFWFSFFLLGLTPVTMKTQLNYTLELTTPENHPRYVSTLSFCLAIPFLLSPLVGYLVDLVGFEVVFLCVSGLILTGGLMTFRMAEPREENLNREK